MAGQSDPMQTLIDEIKTVEDYRSACLLLRTRINAGMEVDSDHIVSLAVKGHAVLEATSTVAAEFMATLRADPRDNGGN